MTPRKLVVSTIGTSLLSSHLTQEMRNTHPKLLIELANAKMLSDDANMLIEQIAQRVESTLRNGDTATIRRKSAELNGVYALYENQIGHGTKDVHILIATDTALGQRCAKLVESHLRDHHITTIIYTPTQLTTANTEDFEAGSKDLIHWCSENIPGYRTQGYTVVFNLVAAFKALQGYLNIIGMFYADQILYLFESENSTPILIPRLPIRVDADALKPFAVPLALMAEGKADLPVADVADLSRAIFDTLADRAFISDWGSLVWNQVRDIFFGEELLAFPRLRYSGSFQRDFRAIRETKQKVELQSILARVSALLEQFNGNRTQLRNNGGLQYETYNSHPAIDHFRVSLALRVNCRAEDSGLTLLNFGSHDYCEKACLR